MAELDSHPGSLLAPNIALVGFMTAGKTQVGLTLARATGWPFRDIDLLIEGVERASVEEVFRRSGEPYFRALETTILADLCRGGGQIIGCGGGTVLAAENRRLLKVRCITVWLKVSGEEVLARLARPDAPVRPLLQGVEAGTVVPALLGARAPLYSESDLEIDTDGRTVEDIAREIALRLRLPQADPPQRFEP